MNVSLIKTEQDYEKALERLRVIFDAPQGSKESDELDILAILIEQYEDTHYPIETPDPIEAILFRMEQMGMKQKDLVSVVGYKSRVSEILNKKRKLNLPMIRKISSALNISPEVLVKEY